MEEKIKLHKYKLKKKMQICNMVYGIKKKNKHKLIKWVL